MEASVSENDLSATHSHGHERCAVRRIPRWRLDRAGKDCLDSERLAGNPTLYRVLTPVGFVKSLGKPDLNPPRHGRFQAAVHRKG